MHLYMCKEAVEGIRSERKNLNSSQNVSYKSTMEKNRPNREKILFRSLIGDKTGSHTNSDDKPDDDDDTKCGIFCYPRWMRRLASLKLFMLTYSIVWLAQGGFYAYLVGAITTIERRFQFSSKQIGLLISINEFFHISLVVFASYFGGKSHKPRVLAIGTLLFALGVFFLSVPHYIYGASPSINVTWSAPPICDREKLWPIENSDLQADCKRDLTSNRNAYAIMALGKALAGIGGSSLYALGTSYIDDSVNHQRSALYLGM